MAPAKALEIAQPWQTLQNFFVGNVQFYLKQLVFNA
jgi:hypothetical protein